MMRTRASARRAGFTLLEVLLASLIAIFLLGGLYFAMDVTLRRTTESREAVEVDNLSRAAFNRIGLDLASTLGPLPPKSGGNSAAGAQQSSAAPADSGMQQSGMMTGADPAAAAAPMASTTAGGGGSGGTGGSAPTNDGSVPTDDGSAEATAAPKAADITFQAGVIGTDKTLTIFASGLPNALAHTGELFAPSASQTASDLRRITYWLRQGGGLCRQERPWVTADGVRNSSDPDLSDEDGDTLVEEVTDATFEYWDGEGWTTNWDGSTPGPDGVTPTGPPRAIRVTLVFEVPANRPGQPPLTKTAVQVIRVPSAPGPVTPTMIEPSTDSGSVTAGSDPASDPSAQQQQGANAAQGVQGANGAGAVGGAGAGGMGPGGGRGGAGGGAGGMGPGGGGGRGGAGGPGGGAGGMGPGGGGRGGAGGAGGGAGAGPGGGGRGGAGAMGGPGMGGGGAGAAPGGGGARGAGGAAPAGGGARGGGAGGGGARGGR
ncbi:hypothetical protein J0H58_33605 [bacterium]|nr:hypothetical protein [bacterium]